MYFLSPLWPYPVNSLISLDGDVGECVDLYDRGGVSDAEGSETVRSDIVWQRLNLSNTRHTVRVSACPVGDFIVVDGFMCVYS